MSTPRLLRAEPATAAALAPFGGYVGSACDAPVRRSLFYGDGLALRKPAALTFDDQIELTVATLDRRPLRVSWLERHFKHTQTFLPLGGRPFVMVLAPPSTGEMPDLDRARAFLFDGSAGVALHVGTWHEFPMALVDGTDIVVLLRSETARDLGTKTGNEARGPDLDKKDLVARTGLVLEVVL